MRILFGAVYLITFVLLAYTMVSIKKREQDIAKILLKCLYAAMVTALGSAIQMLSRNPLISNIGYALFFVGTDWLMFYFMWFILSFCGLKLSVFGSKTIVCVLCSIDSLVLLLNPFFSHMYVLREKEKFGAVFYKYDMTVWFYVHLAIVYMLVLFLLMAVIYKTVKSPRIYKRQYINILIMVALVAGGDVIHLVFDTVVDYMVIGLVYGAILMCHYAFVHVPEMFLKHVLSLTVDKMDNGFIIYDIDDDCVYTNKAFNELFPHIGIWESSDYKCFSTVAEVYGESCDDDFSIDLECGYGESRLYVRLTHNVIYDDKKQRLGAYIVLIDRTEEEKALELERYKSTHDPLTDILNRESYFEEAEKILHNAPDVKYIVICSDIRAFKMINDLFGTLKADEILCKEAELLRKHLGDNTACGRVSGDKFSLVMPRDRFNPQDFIDAINEIKGQFTDNLYRIHIYMGIYYVKDNYEPIQIMVDKALMAINSIKGDYNRIIAYYDDRMMEQDLHATTLLNEFAVAIANEQFEMFLQPLCRADGSAVGAEALCRWRHPERGLIPTGEFIPLFESANVIHYLDMFIWEKAAKRLAKWKKLGRDDLTISVNVSGRDMYSVDVYKTFTDLVEQYGIDPKNLKIEFTETTLITDIDNSSTLTDKLKKYGFQIEIDDFGSGYSSLNSLRNLNADIVKTDMGFLKDMEEGGKNEIILDTIIMLCRKLNMPVVVEGVETQKQLEYLKSIDCELFQGYYFSKPIPADEFDKKYVF